MRLNQIILSAMMASLLPTAAMAQATEAVPDGYKLVWSDDFDGTELNTDNWSIEVNGNGGGNQELQFYKADNVKVKDGHLALVAKRENYSNHNFTSGRINSRNKAYFKHGILQARIKMPKTANGLWPAFWMMGNDYNTKGWPRCGEMDIVEMGHYNGIANGTQDRYFAGTLHYGKSASQTDHQQLSQDKTVDASNAVENDEWHIFTVEWDGDNLYMYYDLPGWKAAQKRRARYFSTSVTASTDVNSPGTYFQKPYFFIFNLAVGGTFTGIYDQAQISALPNAGDEKEMDVDWVRVYQLDSDTDAQYYSAQGTNIKKEDEPELPEDTLTEFGYYGSKALDENGTTTFDFKNATDAVLIGTSGGVTDAFSATTTADYNVDDVKNCLYVWEQTYSALPSEGVNSFGFDEAYNHYQVNSVGWSGLGYASTAGNGKDLSMIDDDYILHFGMRGLDEKAHASQEIQVGNAKFTLGQKSMDGAPVLGDFKRDGSWTYFDIPVKVLKSLCGGDLFGSTVNAYEGNVFAVLSGGVAGTEVMFDNIFFYKNPNVNKNLPTKDEITEVGPYATLSVEDGTPAFNFDNAKDVILIGTSAGVTEALSAVTLHNYNVDEKTNFFWVWDGGDYTGMPSDGTNSMGWNESWTRLQVGSGQWNGAGYASKTTGKDLSAIDNTYYLHFAMKGTDVLQHANQTVTVGNAIFTIGNATEKSNPILGDYKRNGNWYNFDIPVAKLQQLAGGTLFTDAKNFISNVFAVSTTNNAGNEVNLDQVFFYKKVDADTAVVMPSFVTKALDDNGKTTFDIESAKDVVLIGTSGGVTETFKDKTLKDYNVDNNVNFMFVWENTMTANATDGEINSFGYAEGYPSLTVGSVGWSGFGYQSPDKGKDLSMLDNSYIMHFAMKQAAGDNNTYLLKVGNACFAINGDYTDNGTTYHSSITFPKDGEWYYIDLPFSEISSRGGFSNAASATESVFTLLAGGTAGKVVNYDNVFFYRTTATGIEHITVDKKLSRPASRFDGAIYNLAGQRVGKSYKGIVIKNGRKYIQR